MKSILILIDGSDNDADSLRSALAFAAPLGARLTVLHPRAPSTTLFAFAESVFAADSAVDAEGIEARARAAFDAVCSGARATFQAFDGDAPHAVEAAGYAHDLIIAERLSSEEGPQAALLNAALFETGRPVLALPPIASVGPPQTVAVAWNGRAQSARALRSSIPLLQAASRTVVLLGSGLDDAPTGLLEAYLADYGVAMEVLHYDSDRLTARARGRALLKALDDAGAEMLVAGAYGESGSSDIAGLGRATQKVVTAASVPVLMQA